MRQAKVNYFFFLIQRFSSKKKHQQSKKGIAFNIFFFLSLSLFLFFTNKQTLYFSFLNLAKFLRPTNRHCPEKQAILFFFHSCLKRESVKNVQKEEQPSQLHCRIYRGVGVLFFFFFLFFFLFNSIVYLW